MVRVDDDTWGWVDSASSNTDLGGGWFTDNQGSYFNPATQYWQTTWDNAPAYDPGPTVGFGEGYGSGSQYEGPVDFSNPNPWAWTPEPAAEEYVGAPFGPDWGGWNSGAEGPVDFSNPNPWAWTPQPQPEEYSLSLDSPSSFDFSGGWQSGASYDPFDQNPMDDRVAQNWWEEAGGGGGVGAQFGRLANAADEAVGWGFGEDWKQNIADDFTQQGGLLNAFAGSGATNLRTLTGGRTEREDGLGPEGEEGLSDQLPWYLRTPLETAVTPATYAGFALGPALQGGGVVGRAAAGILAPSLNTGGATARIGAEIGIQAGAELGGEWAAQHTDNPWLIGAATLATGGGVFTGVKGLDALSGSDVGKGLKELATGSELGQLDISFRRTGEIVVTANGQVGYITDVPENFRNPKNKINVRGLDGSPIEGRWTAETLSPGPIVPIEEAPPLTVFNEYEKAMGKPTVEFDILKGKVHGAVNRPDLLDNPIPGGGGVTLRELTEQMRRDITITRTAQALPEKADVEAALKADSPVTKLRKPRGPKTVASEVPTTDEIVGGAVRKYIESISPPKKAPFPGINNPQPSLGLGDGFSPQTLEGATPSSGRPIEDYMGQGRLEAGRLKRPLPWEVSDEMKIPRKPVPGEAGAAPIRMGLPRTPSEAIMDNVADNAARAAFNPPVPISTIKKVRDLLLKVGGKTGVELLASTRLAKTTLEFSTVGRQGMGYFYINPHVAAANLPDLAKAFASEDAARAMEVARRADPLYPLYAAAKGRDSSVTAGLAGQTEDMAANFINRGRYNPIRRVTDANDAFLNGAEWELFQWKMATLPPTEQNLKNAQDTLRVFNHVRGYVSVGNDKIDNILAHLSLPYFSPRWVLSRGALVIDAFRPGVARKEAIKAVIGIASTNVAIAALGNQTGVWNVDLDSNSSDFMKLRVGPFRQDMTAGFQPLTVFISRLATGKTSPSDTFEGGVYKDNGSKPQSRWKTVADFNRSKYSPAAGEIENQRTEKDVIGNPIQRPWDNPFAFMERMYGPISAGDVISAYEEYGLEMALAVSLNTIGFGTAAYESTREEYFRKFGQQMYPDKDMSDKDKEKFREKQAAFWFENPEALAFKNMHQASILDDATKSFEENHQANRTVGFEKLRLAKVQLEAQKEAAADRYSVAMAAATTPQERSLAGRALRDNLKKVEGDARTSFAEINENFSLYKANDDNEIAVDAYFSLYKEAARGGQTDYDKFQMLLTDFEKRLTPQQLAAVNERIGKDKKSNNAIVQEVYDDDKALRDSGYWDAESKVAFRKGRLWVNEIVRKYGYSPISTGIEDINAGIAVRGNILEERVADKTLSRGDWITQHGDLMLEKRAQIEGFLKGFPDAKPDDLAPGTPVDKYFALIDKLKDPATKKLDNEQWGEVNAFLAEMSAEDRERVNNAMAINKTPFEREKMKDDADIKASGYWEIRKNLWAEWQDAFPEAKGMTESQYFAQQKVFIQSQAEEYLDETRAGWRSNFPLLAEQMTDGETDKERRKFTNVLNNEQADFRYDNRAIAALIRKWEYGGLGAGELRADSARGPIQ